MGTDLGGGGSLPPGPAPTRSGSAENRAQPRIGQMNLKVAERSDTLVRNRWLAARKLRRPAMTDHWVARLEPVSMPPVPPTGHSAGT